MINFTKIRGDSVEGQRSFFEQLICHLAQLDNASGGEFRRIEGSGGDGGVEALRVLATKRKVGYQAKYYPNPNTIDWVKLTQSVTTALTQHPELERYVIALPCDFTGKRALREGSTDGIWGKWDRQVEHWNTLAEARNLNVKFEPWTAFDIEAALLKPNAQHLIRFFFDTVTFSREWMQRHLNRTFHDLQARYSPDDHVDTEGLKAFDVIYHRANVRKDLQTVFEMARNSNPRAAAAIVSGVDVPEATVTAVENALKDFLVWGDAVEWTNQTWPVFKWETTWYSFTRQLRDLQYAIDHKIRAAKTDTADDLHRQLSETTKLYELTGPEVFGGRWMHLLPIDISRAALFVGPAGAGKSHLLARGAELAWKEGAPIVHLLGQHVLDDDPRVSILKRLEISDWSFHDMLSALNLAAEAANTRSLLVIDAINEGRGTDIWRNHLASFIHEVNEYKLITLVMSCRAEYLPYVVPSEIMAHYPGYSREKSDDPPGRELVGNLIRVEVSGFQTTQEREAALKKFMDDKGIARPTAPVLDAEFFNPLFMSSVCRSMANAGIKVFPRGLHGAKEIFDFVLATKAKALGTRYDGTDHVHRAMLAALDGLAGRIVEHKQDHVPLGEAIEVMDSAFAALPIGGRTWLEVLEGSDILRRDVEETQAENRIWAKPNEVIRFSFQRLQDNMVADRLIELAGTDIENSFAPNGPFSFLLRRLSRKDDNELLKLNAKWVGVIGALWSAVAEKFGKELCDLRSFFGGPEVHYHPDDFRPVFHASIRERNGKAFSGRTEVILDALWKEQPDKKLAILLSTSCIPKHAWNADFLTARLQLLSAENYKSSWTECFAEWQSELMDQVKEITDWAINVDTKLTDTEVTRLASLTLTCLLTVENSRIRDLATKGLANLELAGKTGQNK